MGKIQGSIKGNVAFQLLVPDGWQFTDFGNDSLQVYNMMGTLMVSLKRDGYNMTEQDEEKLIAGFAAQYKGSTPEKVSFKGMNWNKTVYDYGMHQSLFTCIRDGRKISLQLAGTDHENNEIIQAVVDSIEFL